MTLTMKNLLLLWVMTSSSYLILSLLCITIPSQNTYFVSSTNVFHKIKNILPIIKQQRNKQNTYTPLIFFTVPKGLSPICDEIDKVICQIEKECNVHVQRLDVLRQPEIEAVLLSVIQSITTIPPTIGNNNMNMNNNIVQAQPPLLYHRESRQIYQVIPLTSSTSTSSKPSSSSTTTKGPSLPLYIDKERIRAWAKGRYLSPFIGNYNNNRFATTNTNTVPTSKSSKSSSPLVDIEEIDPVEALIDEMGLSSEQLKGKRLMEERTKSKN